MNKTEIKEIIKEKVLIERLELEDITAEEIVDNEPLFIDGLGLDSVEALDVAAGIEEEFKVASPKLSQEGMQKNFYSVDTLVDYVSSLLQKTIN